MLIKDTRIVVVRQNIGNWIDDYPDICTSPTSKDFAEGVQIMNEYSAKEYAKELKESHPECDYKVYKLVEDK